MANPMTTLSRSGLKPVAPPSTTVIAGLDPAIHFEGRADCARSTMDPRNKSAGDEWSGWDWRAATPVTTPSHSPRRLRAVALQHGVDEREAFGDRKSVV